MLLAAYCITDTAPRNTRPFDSLGFILFGGSLALLCYSLSDISESSADLRLILLFITVSLMMMFTYIVHAKNIPYPVIQIRLLKIRTFKISVMGNLCARLGFGGMPFMLPLLLQVVLGYSAQLSGILCPWLLSHIFQSIFNKNLAHDL